MSTGMAPVLLALAATIAYHFGLIIEKRALRALPTIDVRHPVHLLVTLFTAPAWLAGFGLMLVGLGLQVLALARAPVTVVQPVITSGIVVLLVASRIILREWLGNGELACVLAMAAAIVLLALSDQGTAGRVASHASGWLVTAAVALTGAVALLAVLASLRTTGAHRRSAVGGWLGCASGLCYGVSALGIKGVASVLGTGHGGWQMAGEVARAGYLYLAIASSVAGLLLFQTALQRYPVSIIGPVSNVTGSIYFLVVGSLLFGERLPAAPGLAVMRLTGIVVAIAIVAVLSARPRTADYRAPGGDGATSVGAARADA